VARLGKFLIFLNGTWIRTLLVSHMQPWGDSCHRGQGHKLLVLWSPWYDRLLPPPSNTMREGLLPKYLWTSAFVFRQLLLKIIASYPLDIIQTKQTNDLWAWLHLFSSYRSFLHRPQCPGNRGPPYPLHQNIRKSHLCTK